MSKENIIRAWKDPDYRSGLDARERALLPANPAGTIDDAKLAEVAGGAKGFSFLPGCSYLLPCDHSWIFVCL
jgi:mersacidin/lichenicidin family type 2 lantibiotic